MGPLVVAHDVTFDLCTGRRLFERLDFVLSPGIAGLVGANGVGKSTLAGLLAGVLAPSAGSVQRRCAVRLLPQREVPPPVSVADWLADGDPPGRTADALLHGIDPAAQCNTLSGGQWMRVRLARTLDDAFLILDEPSNDLDDEARALLAGFLLERRGGALLVSHDRQLLELCNSILELTHRGLAVFGGGWQEYEAARNAERARMHDALLLARREREQVRATQRAQAAQRARQQGHARTKAARGGMPKLPLGARKRRAQQTSGRLAAGAMAKADDAVRTAAEAWQAMKLQPVMYAGITGRAMPPGRLVAAASSFNIRHHHWVYGRDLDFTWRGNVRIAIRGANGAGKSSLMQALSGAQLTTRGTLRIGGLASVRLDQHQSQLREDLSVLDNLARCSALPEQQLRNTLAQFLFRGDAVLQRVGTLSGGERLRAALACTFLQADSPELMLLDEPTNNLDAGNIAFLEDIVRAFQGAVLLVSHDQRFIERCGVTSEYELPGRQMRRRLC